VKNCPAFEELSSAFSGPANDRLAAHVRSCLECARVWSDLEKMRAAARALPVRVPEERAARALEAALVDRVRNDATPARGHRRFAAAVIAAGVALAAGVGAVSLRAPVVEVGAPPLEAPSVVIVEKEAPEPVIRRSAAAHYEERDGSARLESGVLEIEVPPEQRFVLATGDAELTASAGSFSVEAENDRLMFVWVKAGSVELRLANTAPRVLSVGERWSRPVRRRPRASELEAPQPAPVLKTSEARFQSAWAALGAGANTEAAAELEQLLRETPEHPLAEDAAYWRAIALIRGERWKEAEEALSALRARHPESLRAGEIELFLGWRKLESGDKQSAASYFRAAAESPVPEIHTRAKEGLEAVE
jgi:TolA-binding protein